MGYWFESSDLFKLPFSLFFKLPFSLFFQILHSFFVFCFCFFTASITHRECLVQQLVQIRWSASPPSYRSQSNYSHSQRSLLLTIRNSIGIPLLFAVPFSGLPPGLGTPMLSGYHILEFRCWTLGCGICVSKNSGQMSHLADASLLYLSRLQKVAASHRWRMYCE